MDPLGQPRVSIVMATYNRADTVARAIDSVVKQDTADWELIVVDDGSIDETQTVVRPYLDDSRIRLITFERNRGACAARNAALDVLRGEWFTLLDSDDEMLPGALSTLLSVPAAVDPTIDAVTCNCVDSVTGMLTGKGLDHDQYLDLATEVERLDGEHWGLTKTGLLGGLRFPEDVPGGEAAVFLQVSERARRYYIHKALRVWHTERSDRLTSPDAMVDVRRRQRFYSAIANQNEYLDILRRYSRPKYAHILFNVMLVALLDGDRRAAAGKWTELRRYGSPTQVAFIAVCMLAGRHATAALLSLALRARGVFRRARALTQRAA